MKSKFSLIKWLITSISDTSYSALYIRNQTVYSYQTIYLKAGVMYNDMNCSKKSF